LRSRCNPLLSPRSVGFLRFAEIEYEVSESNWEVASKTLPILKVSKFQLPRTDKIAIWHAWDDFCWICGQKIPYFELEIDHVVPEALNDRPDELRKFRDKNRIDESFPGFQINDFCNLAPAHRRPCNGSKSDYYNAWTMVYLEKLRDKLPRVHEEREKAKKGIKQSKALSDLETALERGDITEEDVQKLLQSRVPRIEDPIVLTFGLAIEDLYRNPEFKDRNLSYPSLCDWLEKDLKAHLAEIIDTPFHYTEPSQRTGETLSVRIVFPELGPSRLARFSRSWWTILDRTPFRILYQTAYRREFPPRRKVLLQTPVKVTLNKDAVEMMDEQDAHKYSRFTVIGYELWDDTDFRREIAERIQNRLPREMRMTNEQIEQEHFGDMGGAVTIRNGEDQEEVLEIHDYQSLVGLECEFADVNPIDWVPYRIDLLDWYNNAPPDEDQYDIESE
jgi:hypothetical protein